MIQKNFGSLISSALIGKRFSLSVPDLALLAGTILLKNVHLEDSRPSLLCSKPSLMFRYWLSSETRHLLIGQLS